MDKIVIGPIGSYLILFLALVLEKRCFIILGEIILFAAFHMNV